MSRRVYLEKTYRSGVLKSSVIRRESWSRYVNRLRAQRQIKRREKYLNYRFKKNYNAMVAERGVGFFHVVFLFLFVIMFFSVATGSNQEVTFTSLLEVLSDSPVISSDWVESFRDLSIGSDWGIFNFLKDFLNTIIQVIGFLLYIVNGLVQVVVYIAYLFRSLF